MGSRIAALLSDRGGYALSGLMEQMGADFTQLIICSAAENTIVVADGKLRPDGVFEVI